MKYLYLFLEFFKIGLFTIGGGYAMIPLMRETVLKYNWMGEEQFYDFLGISESTPGPIAINMATFIGSSQGGLFGSFVATVGVVLPSFIIILLVATLLRKLIKNKVFQAFMNGVKPVVIGLILSTGLILLINSIGFNTSTLIFDVNIPSIVVFVLLVSLFFAVKLIFKKKLDNITLIIVAAALGIGICLLAEVV